MPSSTALIQTKLRIPPSRSRVVQRPRLIQQLSLDQAAALVLVSAPAGSGKTTLLADWARRLQQMGTIVTWYALDEGDNSPATFGAYLLACLEQLPDIAGALEPLNQMLRSSPEIDLLRLLPTVINQIDIHDQEMVMVLDDYHLIHCAEIHQAVAFLLEHRPPRLHLAIGSRANPPLPLAGLRAKGQLLEVRAANLRFNGDETFQFLHEAMQMDVSTDFSERLSSRVEGWAAGLQLAALSLSGHADSEAVLSSFSGGHRHLSTYLFEEVVNQLPEDMQSFLLYTAILERLSASLCDAILNMENSASLLARLETANLFILSLDEEGTWYRYHHLFRDFLLTWLNKTQPGQAAALHRAASCWFAAQGLLREAAYHAFRSADWSFAADFVEQNSFTLIIQSELATINEWCSVFPESIMKNRPRLCIFQGMALAYHFHAANRGRVEARLRQAEQKMAVWGDPAQVSEMAEFADVVRTFLAMSPDPHVDVQAQLQMAERRLAGYPDGDLGRFTWLLLSGYSHLALQQMDLAEKVLNEALPLALQAGLFFGVVETTFHLACLVRSQGRLGEAWRLCQEARLALAPILNGANIPLPALGCLDVVSASILLEQDHLEEAGDLLNQGLNRMGLSMNPFYLATACLTRFRLLSMQGRLVEAEQALEQMDSLWPDIQFLTRGLRIQASLRHQPGEATIQAAREWLASYSPDVSAPLPGLGPLGAAEVFYQAALIWMRCQIALGHAASAWPVLQPLLKKSLEKGLMGRVIELRLLEAEACFVDGREDQALAALDQALSLGSAEGFIQVYHHARSLDDLLRIAARKDLHPGRLERILVAIRRQTNPSGSDPGPLKGLVEGLSERELDVMRLMATGASNQDIANRLVITVGTVKSHINHILGKLNAANRTEAVAKARDLGLIA